MDDFNNEQDDKQDSVSLNIDKKRWNWGLFAYYLLPLLTWGGYLIFGLVNNILTLKAENSEMKMPSIDVGVFMSSSYIVFQALIMFFLACIMLLAFSFKPGDAYRQFSLRKIPVEKIWMIVVGVVALFAVSFIVETLGSLVAKVINPEYVKSEVFSGSTAGLKLANLILPFLFTFIAVGYAEELFFRAFLLDVFKKLPFGLDIILASLIFSLGHGYQGLLGVIATFFMGIVLSLIYKKSRNLHIAALTHALYDLIAVILLFYSFSAVAS